jgi:hypothetical protein
MKRVATWVTVCAALITLGCGQDAARRAREAAQREEEAARQRQHFEGLAHKGEQAPKGGPPEESVQRLQEALNAQR